MVYIFLAEGFEEIEALTQIDLLRRAEIDVKSVGVGSKTIVGAHGISVFCDMMVSDIDLSDAKMLILPGGMPGVTNLYECAPVLDALKSHAQGGGLIAAICAAPLILGRLGLLSGKKAVCYPGFEDELLGAEVMSDSVVVDGNIITAKAAGSAIDFAHAIISAIKDKETADAVIGGIYYE